MAGGQRAARGGSGGGGWRGAGLGAGFGGIGLNGRHDVRKRAGAPTTWEPSNWSGVPSGPGSDVPTGSSKITRQRE